MILVVCALEPELLDFTPPAGVTLLACGVGPVEAASATARALATTDYSAVVNAGIAGVFRGRGRVGDAFLVTEELLADFGREGDAPLTLPGGYRIADRVRADTRLIERIAGIRAGDAPLARAIGVTVSQITATRATAQRLAARYSADVESMEGFAVLRAAELAGVPALEIRGISNYVDEHRDREWDFRAGARATTAALHAVLERLTTSLS